jgi:DNA modification methylase/superfamily II DNA or RNA helicase
MSTVDYTEFLESKRVRVESVGFDVADGALNPMLFDWQRAIVRWALRRGRAAMFEDCGLGKTPQQLEWARQVCTHTGGNVLILTPLAVAAQTQREGVKFGVPVTICRERADVRPGVNVANYERLHKFDASDFAGLVLDESSILKSFDGVTRKTIQEFAAGIRYRLACTATPAPNDLIELTNHAEFLNVMSGKEIIALFFKQDGNTTHQWRLKGHARDAFWSWMTEWSIAVRKPSDLGYDDGAFNLPPLNIHHVTVDGKPTDGMLLAVEAVTLQDRRAARRSSMADRVNVTAGLVNGSSESWLVWCDLNAESQALTRAIPGAVEVTGSDSTESKEAALAAFSRGETRVLISKPSICGWGMNWQHCARVAFVGLSDSYEQFYQAVRRCWRFGQMRPVECYVIAADTEGAVVANIERKERQASEMFDNIVRKMSVHELNVSKQRRNEMDYKTGEASGKAWRLMLGDSCERIKEIPDNTIGLSVFSPPFPGMYAYSNSPRDIGNCDHVAEMLTHFSYMMPDVLRATMPGRMCCIHLMQLTAMQSRDGYIGVKDYRGNVIEKMQDAGWIYAGEVTIDKNPQVQAVRNKERGLMFKTLASDSSMMRMALADYVIYFRKPGANQSPIRAGISQKYQNAHGWITEDEWIEWAAPVWYRRIDRDGRRAVSNYPGKSQATDGIMETDVLNVACARESQDERHLCPLQLGVIERCVKLWSAPGDLVFSPFAGIGSEGYMAVKLARRFLGIELKESYWRVACENLKTAEREANAQDGDLFGASSVEACQ